MKVYEIDGNDFSNIDGFYDEITKKLITPGQFWGRNLDAFNDILTGGFGTPDEGFEFVWINSEKSKKDLGDKFNTIVDIVRDHSVIKLKLL